MTWNSGDKSASFLKEWSTPGGKARAVRKLGLYAACLALPIVSGTGLELIHQSGARATAAMMFLLEVLAVAAIGIAPLAILTSLSAALVFSYDFLPPTGSFAVRDPENVVALVAFVVTAVTGSQLSIRAQRRALEANRRREEMERLQRFSSNLLSSESLLDAARSIASEAVTEFGFTGVELVLNTQSSDACAHRFLSGEKGDGRQLSQISISLDSHATADLHLYGKIPSAEFQRALGNVVSLILGRAKGAEDRVRFESEQRSDELHTTLLNALAHNFRTPLTSIKMAASTLIAGHDSRKLAPEQQRDLLVVVDEEADRLQALIRESLEFARLESHRTHKNDVDCDVRELVDNVCQRVQRYAPPERFDFHFDKDLPPLRGDRLLFEQMLFQVVDNAWKYSLPSALIRISARLDRTCVVLSVHNEGPPVPEQDKERIFERFVRGGAGRNKTEGTGLGLAIARTIAESYGGRLWLDSEPEGPAFRFAIPIGAGQAPAVSSVSFSQEPFLRKSIFSNQER